MSFSARKPLVAALLVTMGSTALVACKSQEAAYRPAPRYSQPATTSTPPPRTTPTYTQPAPTYTQPMPPPPPAAPAQKPGAVACGNGKCA